MSDDNTHMATARLSAANTWLQAEIKRLRLTDAERGAVECGIQAIGIAPRDEKTLAYADTLRGLLERTQ